MFLLNLPISVPILFLEELHKFPNTWSPPKQPKPLGSDLTDVGEEKLESESATPDGLIVSKLVSRLTVYVGMFSTPERGMDWVVKWVWFRVLGCPKSGPLLKSSKSAQILFLSTQWTNEITNPSVDLGIWPCSYANPCSHLGLSSFNLSKLNITTISESLFVAEEDSITSLNSPLVVNGPTPLTHIHCIVLLFWVSWSSGKSVGILDGGFWFRGGIACVIWLAGECVSVGDDAGELAGFVQRQR